MFSDMTRYWRLKIERLLLWKLPLSLMFCLSDLFMRSDLNIQLLAINAISLLLHVLFESQSTVNFALKRQRTNQCTGVSVVLYEVLPRN